MSDPMSAVLREQLDRVEIERAVFDWANLVDLRRPDKAALLVTEDCEIDYGARSPVPVIRGRDAYAAMMREAQTDTDPATAALITTRSRASSHHVSNLSIRFTNPDEAAVQWYSCGRVETYAGEVTVGFSIFDDRFVRTSQGWKVAQRRNRKVARVERALHS
jgi:hypothetical protein